MIAPRGRFWVGFWLLFTLGTLAWVVARQTSAVMAASDLAEFRTIRSVLEAERATLVRRIREAESRAVLVPRAESLGLRLPADSEITIIPSISERK